MTSDANRQQTAALARPLSRQPIPSTAVRVFHGSLFDVYQWEQELFDGSVGTFEKVRRPDTAYVIPVTSDGRLLLARQIQPGGTESMGLLGGRINPGETPEQAARRELREEAGLEAANLCLWEAYQFLPKIDWAIYVFVAYECTSLDKRSLDSGERLEVMSVSFDDFFRLVEDERFGDLEVALRVLRIGASPARRGEAKRVLSPANPSRSA